MRRDITTGLLKPGSWIVQEAVAEQFGISRIPIREALKTLEAEEYVTYVPHQGYRVASYTLSDLIEIFELRDLLEESLIRDAMPRATADLVRSLQSEIAAMQTATRTGDAVAAGIANRRFHFLTFERSTLKRTLRIVTRLWDTADAYRPLYASLLNTDSVDAEHDSMVLAIASGHADTMVALNHQHREHAISHLHILFRERLSTGDTPLAVGPH